MAGLSEKRERALMRTDGMSSGLRACVHEFGYPIVYTCLEMGVSDPNRIRQLVFVIWSGARSIGQKSDPGQMMQWLDQQAEGDVPPATTRALCLHSSWLFIPSGATRRMVEASMAEVSGFNERVTKWEKHSRRLNAALTVARQEMVERRTFPANKGSA